MNHLQARNTSNLNRTIYLTDTSVSVTQVSVVGKVFSLACRPVGLVV